MQQNVILLVNYSMKRKKFSHDEDELLITLVEQYGAQKWNDLAKYMPNRTGRQCRDRYINYLKPGFKLTPWTKEEDETLSEKYKLYGNKWCELEKFFSGRSANSIKNRWNCCLSKNYNNMSQESPPSIENESEPVSFEIKTNVSTGQESKEVIFPYQFCPDLIDENGLNVNYLERQSSIESCNFYDPYPYFY